MNTLLVFCLLAGLLFVALNMRVGNSMLAIVELAFVVFTVLTWLLIRLGKKPTICTRLHLFVLFSVALFAMSRPNTTSSVFCWVLLMPILSRLLLGRLIGLVYSIFFVGCAGLIFFWRFSDEYPFGDAISIANVVISALSIVCFSYVYEVSREKTDHKLRLMALVDPLTGLANRVLYRQWFEIELDRARPDNAPISLIAADIDHFKHLNDTYGHEAGDQALCFVSDLLERVLGSRGRICRIGGEEFSIILPNTGCRKALAVADELCRTMRESPWRIESTTVPITISMGVAHLGPDGHDLKTLFQTADRRLYRSKAQGRDRVTGPNNKQ